MRCKQKSQQEGKLITTIRKQKEICVKVLIRIKQVSTTTLRRGMGTYR